MCQDAKEKRGVVGVAKLLKIRVRLVGNGKKLSIFEPSTNLAANIKRVKQGRLLSQPIIQQPGAGHSVGNTRRGVTFSRRLGGG